VECAKENRELRKRKIALENCESDAVSGLESDIRGSREENIGYFRESMIMMVGPVVLSFIARKLEGGEGWFVTRLVGAKWFIILVIYWVPIIQLILWLVH
jgi:hypothetical protein